ncbi:hypothetical protein [Pseudomonas bohemica]|uniref:hypothetical protein n=1 Tax=Pseudomonas bohemica TaxID=2044872 RepID=UPI000DA63E10|nr:hypothetical protein [Pseudomonas bohemica]
MENGLTIIKTTQYLSCYPITALPPDVHDLMQRSFEVLKGSRVAKAQNLIQLFDVYCHVTATPISYLLLSSPEFKKVIHGFLGAFDDTSLLRAELPTRREYQRSIVKLVLQMRREIPLLPELTSADSKPGLYGHIWNAMKPDLNPVALRYWNGWGIQGRNGNNSYLPIAHVWNSHGYKFAELIYDLYSNNAAKKLNPSHAHLNSFLYYLSANNERWPVSAFEDPLEVNRLFIAFMIQDFLQAVKNKVDINVKTRAYSQFIYSIDEAFLQPGVWARPFSGALPRPIAKTGPGANTNTRVRSDGTVVKVKLITEVPLNMTDSEAIEVLFKKIREDNELVLKWARYRLSLAKESHEACLEMAKHGTLIRDGRRSATTIKQIEPENICCTYVQRGITYLKLKKKDIFGDASKVKAFNLLGIPTMDTVFALQMLLTHAHPTITDSFLCSYELFNKKGQLTGFNKTESGAYQLIGYKDRAGGPSSERKVLLSDEEAEWVQLMISMTDILRKELKGAGNDQWRYLFLHTGGAISTPSRPGSMRLNNTRIKFYQRMVEEFMLLGNRGESATQRFITQLSVTAFRASAGVEVFLRDYDVEEMARVLGHKRYTHALLSRYLPEPILAFFQTRWIRLFQRGIICCAMKGSPRLLEATRFTDMNELHDFLTNHALREIPEHLQNPDYLKSAAHQTSTNRLKSDDEAQVLVSIDTGVLTALLSLSAAVTNAINTSRENLKKTS